MKTYKIAITTGDTKGIGKEITKKALDFLVHRPDHLEIVLTGRDPGEELLELAEYVTEMKKIKHPFDQGIPARKGIEM